MTCKTQTLHAKFGLVETEKAKEGSLASYSTLIVAAHAKFSFTIETTAVARKRRKHLWLVLQ